MNEAMDYIVARFRALEAATPSFDAAVDQLKSVGLERLNEVLAPIFDSANELSTALAAIDAAWSDNDLPGQLRDEAVAAVTAAFSDYRSRYLGAKSAIPTVDDQGIAVTIGATYFDTTVDRMQVLGSAGWKDAGSVVNAVLTRQSYTATGGETSVTVTGGYDPGNIVVAVNGLVLSPADVTVTSGTSIVLPGALSAGDEVSWTKFGAVTLANVYNKTETDAAVQRAKDGMDGTTSNAVTGGAVDCSLGEAFHATVAANVTFAFSGPPASGKRYGFVLEVTHTSGTISWPSSVKWPNDLAPSLTTGKTHLFMFTTRDGGSRWRGAALRNFVN